jgi:hypothetical protein
MFKKIIGFLSLKGWAGVENVYWLIGIGVLVGIGIFYFLMYRDYFKTRKPRRWWPPGIKLNEWQSLSVKIALLLVVLIVLIII